MAAPAMTLAFCLFLQAEGPITLGDTRELFLDDYLIAENDNVTRQLHPARKYAGNPVLSPDQPWEGEVAILYGSVIEDEGKYRMWYYSGGDVAYAESDDGVKWTKPGLGVVEIDGRNTNLVVRKTAPEDAADRIPDFYELFGVHRDDRDPDPTRRYKMGFLSLQRDYKGPHEDPFHRGQRRGLGVAASGDGIRWQLLDGWATEAICDGGTHWMFDPRTGKYLLYGRTKHVDPAVAEAWAGDEWVQRYFWGRSVARVQSADFLAWDVTEPGKAPVVMTADVLDEPGTEIYSLQVFPYESIYVGLVQVFHNRPDVCHLDIQLAASRDGLRFTRVCQGQAFLPVGTPGSWDRFNNSVANNGPILVGDTLRFYYGGRTYRHSPYQGDDKGRPGGRIGLATIPRDRFVSLNASFDGGHVVTRPLQLQGDCLHLNAKSDFGQIVVDVLGADGRLIARSAPVRADALDIPVAWEQGNLNGLEEPVVLRITLSNARLFALWCDRR